MQSSIKTWPQKYWKKIIGTTVNAAKWRRKTIYLFLATADIPCGSIKRTPPHGYNWDDRHLYGSVDSNNDDNDDVAAADTKELNICMCAYECVKAIHKYI